MVFLCARPARLTDLDECLEKIRDYHCHTAETRRLLRQMWQELITDSVSNFALIEDNDAPCGQQIIWFSFKVFVTEKCAESLRCAESIPVSPRLLNLWRQGAGGILSLTEFHRAVSAEGVHCVVLNYGTPRDCWTGEKQVWVASKSVEWSWYSICGYRLQSLHLETCGPFEWSWAKGFGLSLRNEYRKFAAGEGRTIPPNDFPRLFGTDRGEIAAHAGTPLSLIFRYQPPRFFFSAPEQELLLWALTGNTEAELSAELSLAPITLKKRWYSIYERVEAVAPEMWGEAKSQEGKRGSEKKRRLLNYLRSHMEELRPISRPKQKRG